MKVPSPTPRRARRRLAVLTALMTALAVALVGSAGATHSTTDTTAVAFVPVPAKKVMSANSIAAGATESAIVIGGTTTVPSNATTVRLSVTVKGAAAGTITLFPAGNEAGGAGHTVSWAAGATVTETEAENVGMSNKVSVKNSSTKPAVVTLSITGYSTQVTAGDVNSSAGSPGQVLTDNGAGAVWQTPAPPHPPAFGGEAGHGPNLTPFAATAVHTRTVPAGSYLVNFTGFVYGSGAASQIWVHCDLRAPNGAYLGSAYTTAGPSGILESIAVQGVMTTTGGAVRVECTPDGAGVSVPWSQLTAIRVGALNGTPAANARTTDQSAPRKLARP